MDILPIFYPAVKIIASGLKQHAQQLQDKQNDDNHADNVENIAHEILPKTRFGLAWSGYRGSINADESQNYENNDDYADDVKDVAHFKYSVS